MLSSIFRSRLASVGLASVIAVSVLGVGGVALAEGNPSGGSANDVAKPAGDHPLLKRILKDVMRDIIKTSGLDPAVFKQGFCDGKSINEILGHDAGRVRGQVLADSEKKINDALAEGKITQEQATRLHQALPGFLDKLFEREPQRECKTATERPKPVDVLKNLAKSAIETVASVTGLSADEIKADLRSGKSIADIAGEDTDDVLAALDAQADAAIDKAVADGKVKPEKAETLKTRAHERIANFVNNGRPHKPARTN